MTATEVVGAVLILSAYASSCTCPLPGLLAATSHFEVVPDRWLRAYGWPQWCRPCYRGEQDLFEERTPSFVNLWFTLAECDE